MQGAVKQRILETLISGCQITRLTWFVSTVGRDGVILACEILDCCPWFEFADLDVYVSDEDDEEDDDIEARTALTICCCIVAFAGEATMEPSLFGDYCVWVDSAAS